MATLKALKTRIGSVSSSEKITGAMKMISSAKVHKNEAELRKLLPFKNQVKSIMGHLLETDMEFDSPLLMEREVKKVGVVVYGTDDGLCGAYNLNIFKHLLIEMSRLRQEYGNDLEITIFPVGKKISKAVSRIKNEDIKLKAIQGVDSKMLPSVVNNFVNELRNSFITGELDLIEVVYMQFKSMSKQLLTVEQLFPVSRQVIEGDNLNAESDNKLYIFEPDANSIFNEVLPMFVLSTMQEITIENRASEQAARVMAMQSANDNAKKLLESLQLEFNKLRQQGITTELLDILGGQVER